MPRPKEVERDSLRAGTRGALLAAAIEAFARDGYDGANINAISLAAGFAKGTIYNYFKSKRALMLALIDEIASHHHETISGSVLERMGAEARLRAFFTAGFDFVRGFLPESVLMVTMLHGPDQGFRLAMFEAYQPLFRLVGEEIIAPGVREGVFRPVDISQTSNLLMNIYLGTASQVNEAGETWISAEAVADFAWHALREVES